MTITVVVTKQDFPAGLEAWRDNLRRARGMPQILDLASKVIWDHEDGTCEVLKSRYETAPTGRILRSEA